MLKVISCHLFTHSSNRCPIEREKEVGMTTVQEEMMTSKVGLRAEDGGSWP